MDKEEKKKMLKDIWKSIRGVAFLLIVGVIIGRGVLDEKVYREFMRDSHGILWELLGYCFIGFLSIMGSFLIWSLFKLWVIGKDLTKEERR